MGGAVSNRRRNRWGERKMGGKKCNTSWRKGNIPAWMFPSYKSEPETETTLTPELQEVAWDETVQIYACHTSTSLRGLQWKCSEWTTLYSWMCVSPLRNVHSQSDQNDITLLSPETCCFSFLSLEVAQVVLMAGRGWWYGSHRWKRIKKTLFFWCPITVVFVSPTLQWLITSECFISSFTQMSKWHKMWWCKEMVLVYICYVYL